ncbi:AfsR/SARP family transcriptional regulator [Streptomyces litchfieldiae]|uniref:BTAD domain-containing putative transcriptional regulator n=1 Tax=Streptomyces litchfieldiae TaxID=3075543 RepID=A0ABU2MV23_9ACTN|nr:BTAD domain-containing putative transcriptional regulator [Streptomyces sp. DSM 44938]MDT0345469.1 BTAD domain-containing putative transcriptional regulator [Streptomyces sp. DSM 44938]
MDFVVLGPVEIRRDGDVRAVSGRLRRTLLGVLLARANQSVPVDVLTDALWGERADPRAAQRLHLHVHRLRGLLGEPDRVSWGPEGYRLRVAPGELDAERFESLADEAAGIAARHPRRAAEVLRAALDLWRGAPFAELDVPLLGDWAHQLTERRLAALEALYEAELASGPTRAVVAELSGLVREHPARERLHALLITALYRSRRPDEALAAYRTARQRIAAELGLDPGPELRELERRIRAGEPVEPEPDAARRPDAAVPDQLPADISGFVGRDAELAELDSLLSGDSPVPLSVVAGTAGVGKTALAVRWAHRVRDRFPDGQLYLDLHGYGPDQPVPPEEALAGLLRALGLEGTAVPQDLAERAARFRTQLDGRRMLLILDNARTVEQVRPLLPGTASCVTLITSRDALGGLVAREGACRVSLDRPPVADARRLLGELLGDRVAAEPEAADALIERCARLPLTLRIAAELVKSQPGRSIADLAGELADRQGVLDVLGVDGDPHLAVRTVFSWSYQRLDAAAARAFRLFGVHPGHDMDAYAVAALAGSGLRETRRGLEVLWRAHLVDRTPAGRYQPHDLLRAYAAELAASTDSAREREAARDRLFDHYLATASIAMDLVAPYESGRRPKVPLPRGATPPLTTHDEGLRWLDTERDNLLEATRHGRPEFVLCLAETIWRYLDVRGCHDLEITVHTRALNVARKNGDLLAEANARRHLGTAMSRLRTDDEAATDHLRRALAGYRRAGEKELQAATLNNLGILYRTKGDAAQAVRHLELALAVSGPATSWQLRRAALINLAGNLRDLERFEEALGHVREAIDVCGAHDDKPNEANALAVFAELCMNMDMERDEEALRAAHRGLSLARETGYRTIESVCLRLLGSLHRNRGDHEQALGHGVEALALARAVGAADLLSQALNALAATHAAVGRPAEALSHYREALITAADGDNRKELADTRAGMAAVLAGLGEHEQAREHWEQALRDYTDLGLPRAARVRARLDAGLDRRAASPSRVNGHASSASCRSS